MKVAKWLAIATVILTLMVALFAWQRWQTNQSMPAISPVTPTVSSLQPLAIMVPIATNEPSPDIHERPVFWKERGPYVPVAPKVRKPVVKKIDAGPDLFEQVVLLGIYSAGGQSGLIVRSAEGSRRLKRGDEIAGWTLGLMNAGGGIFSKGEEERTLSLQKPTPPTEEELAQQKVMLSKSKKTDPQEPPKEENQAMQTEPEGGLGTKPATVEVKDKVEAGKQVEKPTSQGASDFQKAYERLKKMGRENQGQKAN